jgi:hypothetical protein
MWIMTISAKPGDVLDLSPSGELVRVARRRQRARSAPTVVPAAAVSASRVLRTISAAAPGTIVLTAGVIGLVEGGV